MIQNCSESDLSIGFIRCQFSSELWLIFNKEGPADLYAFLRSSEIPFDSSAECVYSKAAGRSVRSELLYRRNEHFVVLCNCVLYTGQVLNIWIFF